MEGLFTHTKIHISTSTVFKVVLILLLFWLAFYLRDIVLVVISSVVIASAIEPMTKWFLARRIPRTIAVLAIYAAAAAIFAGTFYFLVIPLLGDFQQLTASSPQYLNSISANTIVQGLPGIGSSVTGIINNLPITDFVARVNNMLTALSQNAFTTASVFLGGLLNFVLIVVLSFYLSVQAGGIANFLKIISPAPHRKYVINLWSRAEQKIGYWMQGQLLLAIIVGVITYLGLMLLGVKHALLLAFVAGVFEIIPLFGPILAAIPAITFAFGDGGITAAFLVIGFYLIVQQFESQLIYPLVVKKVVGVPPIISIIALVVGAKLAGFLGLLIAVPLAAIIMEYFHDLEKDLIAEEDRAEKSA